MKKFLLSIFAVLFAFAGVQAQSYVKVTSTPSDWSGDYLIVYEDGANAYVFNGKDAVNGYVKTTIANNVIVPSDDVNACSVEIVAMSNGYSIKTISAGYIYGTSGSNTLKFNTSQAQLNTIELESNGVKITSNTSVLRFNNASNQMRFRYYKSSSYTGQKAIALYKYTEDAGGEDVVNIAEPTFNPANGTTFEESLGVTITAEDGLTVYYSTDDKKSYKQGNTLNITETTTVYAYAENADGDVSDIVSATYKKVELMTIAEAKAAYDAAGANVDVAVDLTGAVVTVNSGDYVFVQDDNSGIQLYKSGANYSVGTKFTAGILEGSSTVYKNMHQIQNAKFSNVAITTTTVDPIVVTVAELNTNFTTYEGRYVKLEDVALEGTAITQGSDEYTLYNRFNITYESADNCVIHGVVACFGDTKQIYPTEIIPAATVKLPEVSVADGATIEQGTEITITPAVENVVTYSVNGAAAVEIAEATTIVASNVGEMTLVVTSTLGGETLSATYTYNVVVAVAKITANLTSEDIKALGKNSSTYENIAVPSTCGLWTGLSYVNKGGYLQLRNINGEYVQSPVFPGNILSVTLTINNTNTRTFTLKDIDGRVLGDINNEGVAGEKITFDVTADVNAFKVAASGTTQISDITVVYEKPEDYALSVGKTGWATLYLGLDAMIPTGVTCYTIGEDAVNGGFITLTEFEGDVLPAHTAVIVNAESEEYLFEYEDNYSGLVAGNLLKGTVVDENITEDAYVLSVGTNGVGLYGAILNQLDGTAWKNNANKAYLPTSAVPNKAVAFYGFDWDGTTGINEVKTENGEVKTIYDLTGRRIEEITAPGIYIINGKKVLVK